MRYGSLRGTQICTAEFWWLLAFFLGVELARNQECSGLLQRFVCLQHIAQEILIALQQSDGQQF
jgi:hypothetical protein